MLWIIFTLGHILLHISPRFCHMLNDNSYFVNVTSMCHFFFFFFFHKLKNSFVEHFNLWYQFSIRLLSMVLLVLEENVWRY